MLGETVGAFEAATIRSKSDAKRYRHKIWSLESLSKPKEFLKNKDTAVSVSKEFDFKQQKMEASWKFDEGLGNIEGVSLEATMLPGSYLTYALPPKKDLNGNEPDKRYQVKLQEGGTFEPLMSQQTFMLKPALDPSKKDVEGWASFEVVKNDEMDYPNWYLRVFNGKLFVELSDDTPEFLSAATFHMNTSLYPTCPGKPMCTNRGTCVDIQNGEGKCKCRVGFKGNACQASTVNIKDPFESSDKFHYKGSKGPDKWASLDKAWEVCNTGKKQSPIDFKEKYTLVPLTRDQFMSAHYKSSPYKIIRKGKDIRLELESKKEQYVNAGGTMYEFSHMDVHVPGEHAFAPSVNPKCGSEDCPFDLELQLVHVNIKPSPREDGDSPAEDSTNATMLGEAEAQAPDEKAEETAAGSDKSPNATHSQPGSSGKTELDGNANNSTKVKKSTMPKSEKDAIDILLKEQAAAEAEVSVSKNETAAIDAAFLILTVPISLGNWPSKFMEKILNEMPEQDAEKDAQGQLNLFDELPQNPIYYRYSGSHTKPPCTEDVVWYVFGEPLEMSADQVQAFYDKNGPNARPVQELNDRTISAALSRKEREEMFVMTGDANEEDEM